MVNLVPKAESMDSTTSQIATDTTPASSSSSFLDINYEAQANVANVMKCDVMQHTDSLTFFNETLELSQEDIQKTLSANMPLNTNDTPIRSISGMNEMSTAIIREPALRSSDFIDDCCEDGNIDVEPSVVHDDDVFVNLDAFDMFVEFPELDIDTKASISCPTDGGNDISIDISTVTAGGGGGKRIHIAEQHLETDTANDIENADDMNRDSAQQTLSTTHFSSSELGETTTTTTTMESRNDLFNISDFSPEWAYPEGGIKVLVTGPWNNQNSNYTVLFDSFPVPTTIVQSGVLRCYCPAHEVGLVTLQVACDGYVISNSCIFEYKLPINTESGTECNGTTNVSSNEDNLYKLNLYNRLESIEERMQIKMEPSDSVCAPA